MGTMDGGHSVLVDGSDVVYNAAMIFRSGLYLNPDFKYLVCLCDYWLLHLFRLFDCLRRWGDVVDILLAVIVDWP